MKKIGNFFKAIWANKNSICAIITSGAAILGASYVLARDVLIGLPTNFEQLAFLSGWFGGHFDIACYVVAGIIALLVLILDIYGIVNHYGIESVEQFAERMAEKKAEAEARLATKEQQAEYKEKLATFNKGIKEIDSKISTLSSKVTSLKTLIDSSLATVDQVVDYNALVAEVSNLTALKENYNSKVAELKELIK